MRLRTTDYPDARAERCLGKLCGIVNRLGFRQGDRGMGDFLTAELESADIAATVPSMGGETIRINAGGGGTTTKRTTVTTLCEFLERYSMYWPLEQTVTESHAELEQDGKRVPDMKYFRVWREDDLQDAGFEILQAETEIEWIAGVDLRSGETVHVPAELIMFASRFDDARHFPSSTNGTACGSSLQQATLNALYERIERDAIMSTWYERRTPERIDVSDHPEFGQYRDLLTTAHSRIELLRLPTPTDVAVIASAWVDERCRTPKFLLFGGAHYTLDGAIRAALDETAEGVIQTKFRLAEGRVTPAAEIDIDRVYNLIDNVDYYMHPSNFDTVGQLLDGNAIDHASRRETAPGDSEAELRATLDALPTATHLTPVAVDITSPDVRELGMYVVAVIVPELVDMALPGVPPVDHPNLTEIRTTNGHPFP
jgi:thiazole/oxazole-forming peptide maturase SagD family component